MFALRRIPEGGCILADEVGLGKTIEAGLIIAQLLAEGANRILIVVPRPLLGQWQAELYTLFAIEAVEAADEACDISGPGIFLVGREYAGGAAGSARLLACPPFDLCIIDEAHEVFAGIHRRYDAHGIYQEDSPQAQTAHRVRTVIGASPVLLLTATPIQNSLAELWGLVQYVDPSGTLLGALPDFKQLFCEDGEARRLVPEQGDELRRRLARVVKRTLRRHAQEFLDRPFVNRSAQLFEYTMTADERALYDDVTSYLLEANTCAFSGNSRQLLLLGFHRRMASSLVALAKSLEGVAARLRSMARGRGIKPEEAPVPPDDAAFFADLEDEDDLPDPVSADDDGAPPSGEKLQAELARVEDFARRARALAHDGKAESLLKAVALAASREGGSSKLVVFTESLTTQDYVRDLLLERGGFAASEVTCFRGQNTSRRARQALEVWDEEVGSQLPPHATPSRDIAIRLALVHEFKTRSRILISTEAGAKGLNLQFCDTVINYDLPWNPQRIEQRIGRCHRYGQTRDVTVINFLASDNDAQRLTFEILSQKLDLFGEVLDMSDTVLHTPRSERSEELATALGPDFEAQLRRIWDQARTVEEVESELRRLRDSLEDRRRELDEVRERTVGLIESRLDESVRQVFREIRDALPETLAELDRDLERVLLGYLDARQVPYASGEVEGRRSITIAASGRLPSALAQGQRVALGRAHELTDAEPLHLAHPLIEAAVEEARASGTGPYRVRFQLTDDAPPALQERHGARGRLCLSRISHRGFEREDRLVVTALFENAEVLRPADAALELLKLPCEDVAALDPPLQVSRVDLDEVVDEELFLDGGAAGKLDQESFERMIDQLDQYMEDRALVIRRARDSVLERLQRAEKRRDGALGADARRKAEAAVERLGREVEDLEERLDRLVARDDDEYLRWRSRAHELRFGAPGVERLLDAEFVLA